MDKAAVLIDNGYFKKVLLAHTVEGLDFENFSRWLCNKVSSEWYRTYLYDCMPYQSNPPTEEEKLRFSRMDKFLYSLKKLPRVEVRLGKLIKLPNGSFKQKGVDIKLTMDLIKLSLKNNVQKVILVACDSDFVPAVQEAKNEGVIIYSCFSKAEGCGIHDELHSISDDRIELTDKLLKEIKKRNVIT